VFGTRIRIPYSISRLYFVCFSDFVLFFLFCLALVLVQRRERGRGRDNKESAKTPDENKEAANAFLPPPHTPSLSFMSSLFTLHLARLTSVAVFLRSLSPPTSLFRLAC